MIYFKHSDLSDKYHVSLKTVHNWIDGAKQGKVNLKLHSVTNRTYVANTPENLLVLNDLADKGKKYRNTLHHKIVNPTPEFYEILERRQIFDIITSLNVHKEIPSKYNYLESGSANWDGWTKQMADAATLNALKATVELIEDNLGTLNRLTSGYEKINVIDLGPGNSYPVKGLLEHLLKQGTLHRYIAIDISQTMLSAAEENVKEWFGDTVAFEGYIRDFGYERFDDLIIDDMLATDASKTLNIVLLLGGTLDNFPSSKTVLKLIHSSMGVNDIFIHESKPDTEAARRYFAFNAASPQDNQRKPNMFEYILNLMNLDNSLYELEMGFDDQRMERYVRARLKTSITIQFNHRNISQSVNIEKGEAVLLLRIRHSTAFQNISEAGSLGFTLLHSDLTTDRQYLLSIYGMETRNTSE